MTQDKGEQRKIIFDKSELNLGGWGFDELLGLGFVGGRVENNKDNIGFSMRKRNNRGFKF